MKSKGNSNGLKKQISSKDLRDYILISKPKNENGCPIADITKVKSIMNQLLEEIIFMNLLESETASDLKFMINDYLDSSQKWNDLPMATDILDYDEEDDSFS